MSPAVDADDYTITTQRTAPRKRQWYWEVRFCGLFVGAGFARDKVAATADAEASRNHHRAVENTIRGEWT